MHPLDNMSDMSRLDNVLAEHGVEIAFEYMPDHYAVVRWPEEYAGNAEVYDQESEVVIVTDGIITPTTGSGGYIYEVFAVWPQGNARYAFYIGQEKMN